MDVKSVLLVSYHSSLNTGDRALLEVNMQQLRAAFDQPRITLAAAWPDEPYFRESTHFDTIPSAWHLIGIKEGESAWYAILRYLRAVIYAYLFRAGLKNAVPAVWRRLFEAYQQADVIASVSSTHFYSTGKYGWPFPVKIFQVELAHLFNKPFYVMPQSIGPLRWGWEKAMLRAAYAKARIAFFRDQASMRLAETIGLPKDRYRFAPDPAFAFEGADRQQALDLLARYGFDRQQPAVGMSLIPWQGRWVAQETMRNYFRSQASFLKRFHEKTGAQVFLFNQVTGPTRLDDDRIAAGVLLEQLGGGAEWFHYVDEILPPEMLKTCYGCMDLFFASRLHSGIFALGNRVPAVFIGYMQKTRGMMEWLGVEDWVIDLAQLNEERLWEKACQAWEERAARHERLVELIPPVVAGVRQTADWIREDLVAS